MSGTVVMPEPHRIAVPRASGEVLVEPAADQLATLALVNHRLLARAPRRIAGRPLGEWRAQIRAQLLDDADRPCIVTGHQPDFIHPGIWAKSVVAIRLAKAVDGSALNLVVDSDAPAWPRLTIPTQLADRLTQRALPYTDAPPGTAFEYLPAWDTERALPELIAAIRAQLARPYDDTMMPAFFAGVASASPAGGFVEQLQAGCQHVASHWGLQIADVRVRDLPVWPLVAEVLLHAREFAEHYNRALRAHRRRPGGGARRHRQAAPSLEINADRCEVPFWVVQPGAGRRRLFVATAAGGGGAAIELLAGDEPVGSVSAGDLQSADAASQLAAALHPWSIRPRALTLTLWARLFVADLFIHGLGGWAYDAITDAIIADYFELPPPAYAAVSATLRLPLPRRPASPEIVAQLQHACHDLAYNPQRHLTDLHDARALLEAREAAIARATHLARRERHDHAARREAFERIRTLNAALLAREPGALPRLQQQLQRAQADVAHNRVADERAYFFALFSPTELEALLRALPSVAQLRV